jgi:ribosomal protein S18 acetylase RimI-like enzyme
MAMEIAIRSVRGDEIEAAGAMLGRAFADAPGYTAILSHLGEGRRARALAKAKTGFTRGAVRHQLADAVIVDGVLAGVSLVARPGQWPVPMRVLASHARGCLAAGPRAVVNFARAGLYMERNHPKEPHYYLFVLGVEPAMQGQGLGKALLANLAARADAEHVPCYLETDKEANVRLYQHAGYEIVSDGEVPTKPAFRMWTMMRPPHAAPEG